MNVTYNEFPNIKRVFPENFLTYDSEYDDSFNKKFKRTKSRVNANISGIFIDNSAYGNYNYYTNNTLNRSRSYSPNLNKTYNTNTFNSVVGGLSQIGKSTIIIIQILIYLILTQITTYIHQIINH